MKGDDTDDGTTLRDVAEHLGLGQVGCEANLCIWGSPNGMGTNGGCSCYTVTRDLNARKTIRQLAVVADHLLESRLAMVKHGMRAAVRIVEVRKAHYELYRCDCIDRDPGNGHRPGCKGEVMSTQPATFAILDEIKTLIEAELGRVRK